MNSKQKHLSESSKQLDLNFGAPVGDGYASWQWKQQEAVLRISAVWGIPLNLPVRLRLCGIDREFTGCLALAEMPARLDRRQPLKLKLGRHVFDSTEIEACSRESEETWTER